ncbi:MAG: preprotein translocase subunit SecG [Actinomycetota bacterium]
MLDVVALVLNIVSSLFLIVFILLHSGKGSGLSDMFGGGGSTLTGGTALERRLDRITVVTAVIFGLSTFWLSWQWK